MRSATVHNRHGDRVLLVENLPEDLNEMVVSMLFQIYPGFKEVRFLPGRASAFIEFEAESQSSVAMQGLQGFAVTPQNLMRISQVSKEAHAGADNA